MNPNKHKKIIVTICRLLIGLVFIFSGFVKAVDPWGSAYKFHDYFVAWNITFLDFSSLPASFFLSALEFVLGVCLLAGVYRRIVSGIILLFMSFMTVLTLYLAIFNPVTDCGCFGDALIITNWQTFYKNLILITAAVIIFVWRKQVVSLFSVKSRSLVVLFTGLFILSVSFYSYIYLPVLDFRPYKIGNNIHELMQIPEGAERDVYETVFIYEKDGVKQEFSLSNYPQEDSGWTFVETINTLVKKGYEPKIHDFALISANGDDLTEEILSNPGYTFLLIIHKLEQADDANVDQINELYDYAHQHGYPFFCLTASTPQQIKEWWESTGAEYPFCTVDDVTLKTVIRSNPGVLLLQDASIVNKWPHSRLPKGEALQQPLEESVLGVPPANHDTRNVVALAVGLIAVLALVWVFDKKRQKKN